MSDINNKEKGHFRKNWIFYALLLIAIGFSGFMWINQSIALKKQTKAFDSEKIVMNANFNKALLTNSENHLELMMKTFVWAVRSEMIRGNQEQVDQYFNQLVKTEKVKEISLVDNDGKIIISTNKKNEGATLATDYAEEVLNVEEVTILNRSEQQVVAAPVLSIDSRIGTLIVLYNTKAFQMDAKQDLNEN